MKHRKAFGCHRFFTDPHAGIPPGEAHKTQSQQIMPQLIPMPTRITAAGNKPKIIEEFIGRVNSDEARLSIARMRSPGGWIEPGQKPEFDEFSLVLAGTLRVTHKDGVLDVSAGQAVNTRAGEWVQYSTPTSEGADYLAVCLPAFSLQTVHRDGELRQHPNTKVCATSGSETEPPSALPLSVHCADRPFGNKFAP